MGCILSTKFEDWDLADSDKFPELAKGTLLPQKWLLGMERAVLLNLKWIPHYHRTTITIFFIQQLLGLIHDGYL